MSGVKPSIEEESFLERDIFEFIYHQMIRLTDFCPEERYLVHGGYALDHIVANEGTITGVLDWTDAKYGDFVYDIAWLDFWSPHDHFAERFQQYYMANNVSVPAYAERLRCYYCYICPERPALFC